MVTLLEVLLFVSTPLPSGLRASVIRAATAPLSHLWRSSGVNTDTQSRHIPWTNKVTQRYMSAEHKGGPREGDKSLLNTSDITPNSPACSEYLSFPFVMKKTTWGSCEQLRRASGVHVLSSSMENENIIIRWHPKCCVFVKKERTKALKYSADKIGNVNTPFMSAQNRQARGLVQR